MQLVDFAALSNAAFAVLLLIWGVLAKFGFSLQAARRAALACGGTLVIASTSHLPFLLIPGFDESRDNEVLVQAVAEVLLIVLAIRCWQIPREDAMTLIPAMAGVIVATDFEPVLVFLFAITRGNVAAKSSNRRVPIRGASLLGLAVGAALLTSMIEMASRGLLQSLLGEYHAHLLTGLPSLQPGDEWLIPAANLGAFTLLALLQIGFMAWRPALVTWPRSTYLFAFVSVAAVPMLLLRDATYPVAKFVLLLGLSQTLVPWLARQAEHWKTIFARSSWLAVVGSLAIAFALGFDRIAAQTDASANTAALDRRPNVILITLDTVRVQSLGLYGHDRATTPELERWAARGLVFDQAMAPASWTLPSHASLFTGRWPHEHRADFFTPLDRAWPTLAEALGSHGYSTAGFVANMASCGRHTGLARGFEHFSERPGWTRVIWHTGAMSQTMLARRLLFLRMAAPEINEQFLNWLARRQPGPYFAFLNYLDAHQPYEVPDPAFDRFSTITTRERKIRELWRQTPVDQANPLTDVQLYMKLALDTYEGSIAYLDHHLGRLLDELDRRDAIQDTLVLITSDHGEHFGERGLASHAVSLYRQLIEVPLVVLFEGRLPAGRRLTGPLSLTDLPSTVLNLLDLRDDAPFPGRSLARFWDPTQIADPSSEEPLLAELSQIAGMPDLPNSAGPIKSLVADGLHYIRYYGRDREELFDLDDDPLEQRDLAATDVGRRLLPRLRHQLDTVLQATAPPPLSAMRGDADDTALAQRLVASGLAFCPCGPCQRSSARRTGVGSWSRAFPDRP